MFCHGQTIEPIVYDFDNGCISPYKSLFDQEMDDSNYRDVALNSLTFTDFMGNVFVNFIHPTTVFEILGYSETADVQYLRHFSDTLTWVLFTHFFGCCLRITDRRHLPP